MKTKALPLVLTLSSLIMFISGCSSSDDKAFESAEEKGAISAYEGYLRNYPYGEHSKEAKSRIDGLRNYYAFEAAKKENTVMAYTDYLSAYPNGLYAREAQSAINRLKIENVMEKLSISNFYWYTEPLDPAEKGVWDEINKYTHNMYASFMVHNAGDYAIKDFKVTIDLSGNSGTHVQTITSGKIYELVNPRKSVSVKNVKIGAIKLGEGQAKYKVTDFEFPN